MIIRGGRVPLYQQIAGEIRQRIEAGAIPPGHAIPSERDIELQYGVSRITATKAMHLLRDEGLVYRVNGEGTFVGPESAPRVSAKEKPYRVIAAEIVERIRSGQLQPDQPIPSEKTLMQQYSVAKATARNVVRLLREQGWVDTVPMRGTYVQPRENWPKD